MTIKKVVTQTCNGCGFERELLPGWTSEQGGWREVKSNKHLCPDCIDKALTK